MIMMTSDQPALPSQQASSTSSSSSSSSRVVLE